MIQSNRSVDESNKQRKYRGEQTFPTEMNDQYQEILSDKTSQKKQSYDEQFNEIYEEIIAHDYFTKITKHEKIRINKWLTKLSNISTNNLWKKNRNNYIKLIKLMFDCQIIIAPFLMMPPDRDLHKLTTHQINVIIDQVDKLIDEREQKNFHNKNSKVEKVNKVLWTQESAYIDHQNSLLEKNHKSSLEKNYTSSLQKHNKSAIPKDNPSYNSSSLEKLKDTESDCKRTNESSSVTASFSKISENSSIPPRYPVTTKNKSTVYQQINQQSYFIRSKQNEKHDNRKYFSKKQLFETFQTQQTTQEEYLMIKNSSLRRGSPVFEKDVYNVRSQQDLSIESQSREAINILRCGFKLLQKIPLHALQEQSLDQMKSFRKILLEHQFLKKQFEKQNFFLEELANREHQKKEQSLNDCHRFNSTQRTKGNQKKKKLTLTSQPINKV